MWKDKQFLLCQSSSVTPCLWANHGPSDKIADQTQTQDDQTQDDQTQGDQTQAGFTLQEGESTAEWWPHC